MCSQKQMQIIFSFIFKEYFVLPLSCCYLICITYVMRSNATESLEVKCTARHWLPDRKYVDWSTTKKKYGEQNCFFLFCKATLHLVGFWILTFNLGRWWNPFACAVRCRPSLLTPHPQGECCEICRNPSTCALSPFPNRPIFGNWVAGAFAAMQLVMKKKTKPYKMHDGANKSVERA